MVSPSNTLMVLFIEDLNYSNILFLWQGGGWCSNVRTCVYWKTSQHGSLAYMEKEIAFTGILSDKAEYNPGFLPNLKISCVISAFFLLELSWPLCCLYGLADFYNWNRIKLHYCDGASFSGDSENQVCIRDECCNLKTSSPSQIAA